MPTYVTRVVVTQTDEPPGPDEGITAVSGYTRWIVAWTKSSGLMTEFKHALYSKDAARRLAMNLLQQRPPGNSVQDVLTLVGFEG